MALRGLLERSVGCLKWKRAVLDGLVFRLGGLLERHLVPDQRHVDPLAAAQQKCFWCSYSDEPDH